MKNRSYMRIIHDICFAIGLVILQPHLGAMQESPIVLIPEAGAIIEAESLQHIAVESEALKNELNTELKKNNGSLTVDRLLDIWSKASRAAGNKAAAAADIIHNIPKTFLNETLANILGAGRATIMNGPLGFKNSFILTVKAMLNGNPIEVSMFYAPILSSSTKGNRRGGVSLSIGVPQGTPLEQLLPEANLKPLGTVPLLDLRCVVSDFEYIDKKTNYSIAQGFTVIAALDPLAIGILKAEKTRKIIQYDGGPVYAIGAIGLKRNQDSGAAEQPQSAESTSLVEKIPFTASLNIVIPPTSVRIKQVRMSDIVAALSIPMPLDVKNELQRVIFNNLTIRMDLTTGSESISLAGNIDCFGVKNIISNYTLSRDATTADKSAMHNTLSLGFPQGTPIAAIFPTVDLKSLGNVPVADFRSIFSDHAYTDLDTGYQVVKGVTIMVSIDPSTIPFMNSDKVKKVVQYKGGAFLGLGTITAAEQTQGQANQNKLTTSFKIIVPSNAITFTQFSLNEVTDLLRVPMPDFVKSQLSNVVFNNVGISMDLTPNYESLAVSGDVNCFGASSIGIYKIFKADISSKAAIEAASDAQKMLLSTVSFKMPDSWNIKAAFPQLTMLPAISIKNPMVTFVSQSYRDPVSGADMEKGTLLDGYVDMSEMGKSPIFNTLGKALGHMEIHGLLAQDPAASRFEVTLGKDRPKEIKVSLGDLVSPHYASVKKELSRGALSIGEVQMRFGGKEAEKSVKIQGSTLLLNVTMPTELRLLYVQDNSSSDALGEWKGDLIITIPQKVKGINAALDLMNELPVSSLRLALIEVPFYDEVNHIEYQEGLNVGGYLSLSGKYNFLNKLLNVKGPTGLNINGVVGKMAEDSMVPNLKLEASLANAGIHFGHNVTMKNLKLVIALGIAPSLGVEGTIATVVPQQFRPKIKKYKKSDVATSMDIESSNLMEIASNSGEDNPGTRADTPVIDQSEDILLTAEDSDEDDAGVGEIKEEIVQIIPEDTPIFTDTTEDTSDFGAPVGSNKELTFTGALAVSGDAGILSCSMDGVVDILGLVLKEVGLTGQLNMATLAPTGLGFRANMQIGNGSKPKYIDFAAKMAAGVTTTSYMWQGSYKGGLYFGDLVNIAYKVVKRAPQSTQTYKTEFFNALNRVPNIGIDELSMSIVPAPTEIAGKSYAEGISGAIIFNLFGARGNAALQMGPSGVSGNGALSKIALPSSSPQFIISNVDGTAGPQFHFNIGNTKGLAVLSNDIGVDGILEIKPLAMKSAVTINLGTTGGSFYLANKTIFGLYQVDLEGKLPLRNMLATQIKANFKTEALTKLSKQLKDASKDFIEDSKKELDNVRNDIKNTYDEKIKIAREIVSLERAKAVGALDKASKQAKADINDEIKKTKDEIARLEQKIKDKKRQCKRAKWYRKGDVCAKVGFQLTDYGLQLGAQKTYLEALLKPGKTVAKGSIGAAKAVVNVTPIDMDPRVASLITAKETALTGLKVGSLSAQSLGELGKLVASLGDKAVNVKSVSLEVGLQSLIMGKLPKFSIEATFLGKKVHVKDFQFDLRDAPSAAAQLTEQIIGKMKF